MKSWFSDLHLTSGYRGQDIGSKARGRDKKWRSRDRDINHSLSNWLEMEFTSNMF